ncbi:MAG: hypothetical protein AB1481_00790 [Candidatus Omnitrophota bacterium]
MKEKKSLVFILVVLLCVLGLGVVKDELLKGIITVTATKVVGAPVRIEGFSLGIFSQKVVVTGFKLYNPKGFPEGLIVDLPKASVKLNLLSLLEGRLHLRELTVELRELGLTKNIEKKLNVDSLAITEEAASKPKEGEKKKSSRQMPMHIDVFNLSMGRVVYKDYSQGAEPSVQVYDINIKKTYKNIKSAQQLVLVVLTEPMRAAGIKGATIYGLSALAGVGMLPAVAVISLTGQDSVQAQLNFAFDRVYAKALDVLKKSGSIKSEDKAGGIIKAVVDSADVAVKLNKVSPRATEITVSARRYLVPKREIASGIVYKITEELR